MKEICVDFKNMDVVKRMRPLLSGYEIYYCVCFYDETNNLTSLEGITMKLDVQNDEIVMKSGTVSYNENGTSFGQPISFRYNDKKRCYVLKNEKNVEEDLINDEEILRILNHVKSYSGQPLRYQEMKGIPICSLQNKTTSQKLINCGESHADNDECKYEKTNEVFDEQNEVISSNKLKIKGFSEKIADNINKVAIESGEIYCYRKYETEQTISFNYNNNDPNNHYYNLQVNNKKTSEKDLDLQTSEPFMEESKLYKLREEDFDLDALGLFIEEHEVLIDYLDESNYIETEIEELEVS